MSRHDWLTSRDPEAIARAEEIAEGRALDDGERDPFGWCASRAEDREYGRWSA